MGPGNATAAGALTWARGFLSPSPIWAVSSLPPRGYHPSAISHCMFSLEKGVVLSAGWWLAGSLLSCRLLGPFVGSEISRGRTSGWVPCPVLSYASTGSSQQPATGGVFIFVASCCSKSSPMGLLCISLNSPLSSWLHYCSYTNVGVFLRTKWSRGGGHAIIIHPFRGSRVLEGTLEVVPCRHRE